MNEISDARLPEAFAGLERFCRKWALDTNSERYAARISSSMEELREFYDAMLPRMEEALAWLDRLPIDALAGADLRLLKLCLALSEVGLSIEVYKAPVLKLAPGLEEFAVSSAGMTVG